MKFKLNPLTGEFDYTSDSANKEKLNPMTGEFNLVEGDGPFSQIFNPLNGKFNLGTKGGGGIIAEVTGNGYINLTNAVANHLMELKAYGGTEQDLTPTPDNPVDIVSNNGVIKYGITSKNLLDMSESNIVLFYYINNSGQVLYSDPNFYNSKYIPVKPSTTYTWSTSVKVSYLSIMEYDSNKQFLKRTLFTNDATTLSNKITLSANTAYVLLGSNMDSATITYEKISAVDRQFEEGNTATSYVPYEEGIYTDGTVETMSNKFNLFDVNKVTDGYYYTTQGQYDEAAAARLTDFISVQQGVTYSFIYKAVGGPNVRLNYFDTNKTWINQVITSATSGDYTYDITPAQDGYIRISANRPNAGSQSYIDWDNMAIEADGSTATAEMLLKVGGYVDEQEILSGNITRKVGIKVLDGTENDYAKRSDVAINYTGLTDRANGAGILGICSHFVCTANNASTAPVGSLFFNVSNIYLHFFTEYGGDVASFKAWLAQQYAAGTPVIILYPLAEETTESVAGQTMNIPAGNSTIEITQASIDNLGLYAKYLQSN